MDSSVTTGNAPEYQDTLTETVPDNDNSKATPTPSTGEGARLKTNQISPFLETLEPYLGAKPQSNPRNADPSSNSMNRDNQPQQQKRRKLTRFHIHV